MKDPLRISGALSKRDAKRLTNAIRSGTVGPTTLYYAGVTAPIIGAGMALISRSALDKLHIDPFWLTMLPSICAAMAGIVWYLIFMRWSYRHTHGRAGEIDLETRIELNDETLIVSRGLVETHIDWDAIDEIKSTRSYTLISFDGTEPLMIPHDWFGEKTACEIFMRRLGQGMKSA